MSQTPYIYSLKMIKENKSKSSKKDHKFFRFAWEELHLKCEWDACKTVIDEMPRFLDHIEEHMRAIASDDYECKWEDCDVTWPSYQDLYCHTFYHAFHTKLKCHGQNFLKRKNMPMCTLDSQTRNAIPEIPSNLVCYWDNCEVVYHNPEVFYRHVDMHSEDFPKGNKLREQIKCLWQGCNSLFSSQYKLKDHMRSHTQEKLLACPTCGSMFASRTKFVDHIHRQSLANEKEEAAAAAATTFYCNFCGCQFASARLLKDHARNHVHQFKCPYCNMTCPSMSALKVHIAYRHSDYKPLSCEYCDYKCKRSNDLRRHLEIHNAEPSYHCPAEDCDMTFRTQSTYLTHVRRCHEGESKPVYLCHLCDKSFTRGYYLTKHLIVKHKFECPSGHRRFRYERHADGFYKVQMSRYETIAVAETVEKSKAKEEVPIAPKEAINLVTDDVHVTPAVSIPLIMYMDGNSPASGVDGAGGSDGKDVTVSDGGVPDDPVLLEIHGTEGNTLLTSDGSAVVYLHADAASSVNGTSMVSNQKTVQIINQDSEGRTIVQTGVVLAEGGDDMDTCVFTSNPV